MIANFPLLEDIYTRWRRTRKKKLYDEPSELFTPSSEAEGASLKILMIFVFN